MESGKNIPKDEQIFAGILDDLGIKDYEDGVLHQMLKFTNKYVENCERKLRPTPDKALLDSMAKRKNSIPLPQTKSSAVSQLPPDRYSQTACNDCFKSREEKAPKIYHFAPFHEKSEYVENVIEDAREIASDANKKTYDNNDIARVLSHRKEFERKWRPTPDKGLLDSMAKRKNSIPLPQTKSSAVSQLPPDRYSQTACNDCFKSREEKAPKIHHFASFHEKLELAQSVIEDARKIASNANKKTYDNNDIAHALSHRKEFERWLRPTPDKGLLDSMAKRKNSIPLPQTKSSAVSQLPPDCYSQTACDDCFKSREEKTPKIFRFSALPKNSVKVSGPIATLNKPSPITTNPIVTKPNNNSNGQ
ncbi:hypothetical protein TNCV_2473901 [Trichonephila clavipes]|nr:hypothetical protein TNCV_2473901 [Trichonephila clavipes]